MVAEKRHHFPPPQRKTEKSGLATRDYILATENIPSTYVSTYATCHARLLRALLDGGRGEGFYARSRKVVPLVKGRSFRWNRFLQAGVTEIIRINHGSLKSNWVRVYLG